MRLARYHVPYTYSKDSHLYSVWTMRPAGRYRHVTANGGGCRVGLMELAREATSRDRGSFLWMLSLTPWRFQAFHVIRHARSCSPPRGQISQCPLFSDSMRRADVAWSGEWGVVARGGKTYCIRRSLEWSEIAPPTNNEANYNKGGQGPGVCGGCGGWEAVASSNLHVLCLK